MSEVVADYTRVVAPFDGVVVERKVDPGSFVQNATTGQCWAVLATRQVRVFAVARSVRKTKTV